MGPHMQYFTLEDNLWACTACNAAWFKRHRDDLCKSHIIQERVFSRATFYPVTFDRNFK